MSTCKVQFKQKLVDMGDGKLCFYLPNLDRRHCDMDTFRQSSAYGAYANSDLFPAMLKRALDKVFPKGTEYAVRYTTEGRKRYFAVDSLPDNVIVNDGFLATVTIELDGHKR